MRDILADSFERNWGTLKPRIPSTEPAKSLPFLHPLFSGKRGFAARPRAPNLGLDGAKQNRRRQIRRHRANRALQQRGPLERASRGAKSGWPAFVNRGRRQQRRIRAAAITCCLAMSGYVADSRTWNFLWTASTMPPPKKPAANYPDIRLLHVPNNIQNARLLTLSKMRHGQICTPQSIGTFSAVGYFFGRKLNQDLKIPIGLIESNWGGTPAESWVSEPALKKMGDFDANIASMHRLADNPESLDAQRANWWKSDEGTNAGWQKADWNDADWKTMAVPAAWGRQGLSRFRWRDVVSPRN